MKSFFLMIGFFTRLPAPKTEFTEARYQRAVRLLPLVGLVIGVILTLVSSVALISGLWVRGAVLLCAYIALSGGLHFDGLADACDGVYSGKSAERALEIMKDSRIGVFGALGVFMTGIMYFTLFLDASIAALLVFPVCGRACCLISASLAPYARSDGMGKITAISGGAASVFAALISIAAVSALTALLTMAIRRVPILDFGFSSATFIGGSVWRAPLCSLISSAAAVLATIFMTRGFKKKLGGVTGDTFGAVIEISSVVFLFAFAVISRFILI